MNRRDFLKSSVLAGASASLATSSARPLAPSDRVTVGFIGCGARAHELLRDAMQVPGVEVVALADAYTGRAERARARTAGRAAIVADYRRILADPGVDTVFIVTPDHWHGRMAVEALHAGKDIYLEKPMSYSIEDGRAILDASRRSDRILQVGSQGVSAADTLKARELIAAGRLGQVTMVRAAFNRNSDSGAWLYPIPPDASRKTVNWAQFLGPAPERPFDLERFFRWRCYWDYSGGIATDLFVHLVSQIAVALDAKMPARVVATGATYKYGKTHEVPDTVNALLTYPEGFTANLTCTFTNERGSAPGLEILGTEGSLRLEGDSLTFLNEPAREDNRWVVASWPEELERAYYADPKVQAVESPSTWPAAMAADGERWESSGRGSGSMHVANFFDSVRTRRAPVEDALFGHRAAACAHMVNQSIRENRGVEWDFDEEKTA